MECKFHYFDKNNGREFNCGKCLPCRINTTSQWTLRMVYELQDWVKYGASFITLTYDEEHLPKNFGLQSDETTKFFKRLRINLNRHYGFNYKIKYYACGEYGDSEKVYIGNNGVPLGRPHYHAIVYGLDDINDVHRQILVDSWGKCDPYLFDKRRGKDSAMQDVTIDDIRYVAGYVQKKLNGDLAEETYGDRLPPFSRVSHGMGLNFAELNKERLSKLGYTHLKGQKIGLPKYLRDKLGICQTDLIHKWSLKDLSDSNEFIFNRFNEHLSKLGLSWLIDDPIKNNSILERRFQSWIDKWNNEYYEQILIDYNQGRLLRGKQRKF